MNYLILKLNPSWVLSKSILSYLLLMILFNDIALDMLLVFKYLSILINLSFLNDFLMNNKGNLASSITLYFSMLSSSNYIY